MTPTEYEEKSRQLLTALRNAAATPWVQVFGDDPAWATRAGATLTSLLQHRDPVYVACRPGGSDDEGEVVVYTDDTLFRMHISAGDPDGRPEMTTSVVPRSSLATMEVRQSSSEPLNAVSPGYWPERQQLVLHYPGLPSALVLPFGESSRTRRAVLDLIPALVGDLGSGRP